MEPVAIGVDIGGTKMVAAVVAADGGFPERLRRPSPRLDAGALVDAVVDVARELDPGGELPVGVGIAGIIEGDGVVRYGPNIGIENFPFGARLIEATGRHVVIGNDANVAMWGEFRVGAARDADDAVMFTLGTGVGGGVVTAGRLVLGRHGYAGELGHVVVEQGGRPCPCGSFGCLEAYASGTAIEFRARRRLLDLSIDSSLRGVQPLTGKDVTTAAVEGDDFARDVLAEAGTWLGVGAASVVNALDPAVVVVGGGAASEGAPYILPATRRMLGERIMGRGLREPPAVVEAELGDDAGLIGAALLAAA